MAITVAVAGVGERGSDWVREIKAAPAFELVACVDVDSRALERASQSFQIPAGQCFLDLDKAITESGCQAVVVATPADCHAQDCQTALAHSLAVLVEKPFSVSLAEANHLVLLSERAMISFSSGARAFYSATYESSGHEFFENGQEFYARFVGELGTLHVFQRWLILCAKGKLPRLIRRGPREVTEEQILLEKFEQAVLGRAEASSSGRDNLQTMAILEACVRSAAERRWINPQELLNEFK